MKTILFLVLWIIVFGITITIVHMQHLNKIKSHDAEMQLKFKNIKDLLQKGSLYQKRLTHGLKDYLIDTHNDIVHHKRSRKVHFDDDVEKANVYSSMIKNNEHAKKHHHIMKNIKKQRDALHDKTKAIDRNVDLTKSKSQTLESKHAEAIYFMDRMDDNTMQLQDLDSKVNELARHNMDKYDAHTTHLDGIRMKNEEINTMTKNIDRQLKGHVKQADIHFSLEDATRHKAVSE